MIYFTKKKKYQLFLNGHLTCFHLFFTFSCCIIFANEIFIIGKLCSAVCIIIHIMAFLISNNKNPPYQIRVRVFVLKTAIIKMKLKIYIMTTKLCKTPEEILYLNREKY